MSGVAVEIEAENIQCTRSNGCMMIELYGEGKERAKPIGAIAI